MTKPVEFVRVFWTEWSTSPPYEHRKFAELTNKQYQKYDRLKMNVSLIEAAEYAQDCHKQNLIKYADRKRVLLK